MNSLSSQMRESRRRLRCLGGRQTALMCAIAAAYAMPGGVIWPSSVWAAATAGETARARTKLQEGAGALDQGDYEQALARFQEAFEIVPSPKIYFNFGLAHEGLAHHAEALDSFERFLAEAKDATAATRLQAERYVATLRPRVGSVVVDCATAGAEVRIDGRALGTTPLGRRFHVAAGSHQLVVQQAGLAPFVRDFSVAAGDEVQLVATLAPLERAVAPTIAAPVTRPPLALVQTDAPAAPRDNRAARSRLFLGLGATAVILVAVGITLAIVLGGSTSYPRTDAQISGN
jgi:hypothetical protein